MIYTVTFNPSLDYYVDIENLNIGTTNRSTNEHIKAGGKGINVSIMLNNLGIKSIPLGFIAGFTGAEIKSKVEGLGLKSDFIELKNGYSRINIKIKGNNETEINASGPIIDPSSIMQLTQKLSSLENGDILVLSGNIPPSIPASTYADIIKNISSKDILTVVDATGDLLINTLGHKPFLIKPNLQEISDLFNVKLETYKDVIPYAKKLRDMGASNVLISMGSDGGVLATQDDEILICKAPLGKSINSVGAGDATVAGFIAGWHQNKDIAHAFKMGISSGSASAFSLDFPPKSEVYSIYEKLEIEY